MPLSPEWKRFDLRHDHLKPLGWDKPKVSNGPQIRTYIGGVSGAESRPLQPYDDKCSNQEGVKVGRPTPYIGAPSDVNFIFFHSDCKMVTG